MSRAAGAAWGSAGLRSAADTLARLRSTQPALPPARNRELFSPEPGLVAMVVDRLAPPYKRHPRRSGCGPGAARYEHWATLAVPNRPSKSRGGLTFSNPGLIKISKTCVRGARCLPRTTPERYPPSRPRHTGRRARAAEVMSKCPTITPRGFYSISCRFGQDLDRDRAFGPLSANIGRLRSKFRPTRFGQDLDRNRPILGEFGQLSANIGQIRFKFCQIRQELGNIPLLVHPKRPGITLGRIC